MIATAKTKKNEVIQSYKRAYYSNIKFFQTIKSVYDQKTNGRGLEKL